MISAQQLIKTLFDPRGRADRGDMAIGAVAMVAIEALLLLSGADDDLVVLLAKGFAFWIGIAVSAKRLHDLGHSAWWLAAGAGALCIWTAMLAIGFLIFLGTEEFTQGSIGLIILVGLIMLPAIGCALWLHLAEGEPQENRFGPPKGAAAQAVGSGQTSQA